MNVQINDVSSIRKMISVEVPAEMVDQEIEKAYKKVAKSAKIKGFRPGKVPRSVVEQYYGPQMEEQALTRLINESYFKVLVDNKIAPVSDPEITETGALKKGKAFSYVAQIDVRPQFDAVGYIGLSLQKEKLVLDSSVVDSRIEEMRSSRSQVEVSAREKAERGDFVDIDFEGFIDEVPFDGGKAEGHQLELGSGNFIPGFEDQLVGATRGADLDVNVSFPEAYGNKDLAGKPAVFKVKVHEIKEKVLPALDDEFAKGFGLESLEELRSKIEENHNLQEKNRVEGDLRERLMEELVKANPIEVPEALVASQLEYMLDNVRNRMKSQGMSLEMLGMNDERFKDMYSDTAVKQVQGSLILESIARLEGIKVEAGEIDGKLSQIAEMSNAPLDAVKKYYASPEARQGLVSQIVEEKVLELILGSATVVEVAKEELADQKETENEE